MLRPQDADFVYGKNTPASSAYQAMSNSQRDYRARVAFDSSFNRSGNSGSDSFTINTAGSPPSDNINDYMPGGSAYLGDNYMSPVTYNDALNNFVKLFGVTQREANEANIASAERAMQFEAEQARINREWQEGIYNRTADFNAQQSALNRSWQDAMWNKSAAYNAEEASKNRSWQEYMSNTSYQRAVNDMRSAGINPILAYSQGGANNGSGATATIGMPSGSSASLGTLSGSSATGHQASSRAGSTAFDLFAGIVSIIGQVLGSSSKLLKLFR